MKKELRNIRLILPILHIVASFLYERCILIFRADIDVVAAIPLNNAISDRAEQIIAYAVAKLFAMLAVFALWKTIGRQMAGSDCLCFCLLREDCFLACSGRTVSCAVRTI